MTRRRPENSIAKVLEGVCWDAAQDEDRVSLLEPMNRYFSNFPWEGQAAPGKPGLEEDQDQDKGSED
jgi:hypothetical protein